MPAGAFQLLCEQQIRRRRRGCKVNAANHTLAIRENGELEPLRYDEHVHAPQGVARSWRIWCRRNHAR
jgi:hypothetical protein